jgi:branched-chain amino acid transport system permease protein
MSILRRLTEPRVYLPCLGLCLLLIAPLTIESPFYLHILVMILFYAAVSQAWNIIAGYGGQLSLGHAAFFGVGAYTSTLLFLQYGVTPWIGAILGGFLAAATALAISFPCFRLRGPFFTLSTIAFGEVIRILAIYFRDITKGSVGLQIPFRPSLANLVFREKATYVYLALGFLLLTTAVAWWVERSKLGHELVALREDEDAAEAVGINTHWAKLTAVMISGFLTALGGTFYAQFVLFIEPYSVFSGDLSTQFALVAIIGGIGTVSGPIIGSFIVTPMSEFARAWLGGSFRGLHFLVYGIVLIIVVILIPRGLGDWLRAPYRRFLMHLPGWRPSEVPTAATGPTTTVAPLDTLGDGYLLECRQVSKSFRGLAAVDRVDLAIRPGEIVGLIGPNGAGKSTLFNVITSFHLPDHGEILFAGKRISQIRPPHRIIRRGIGRTFQVVKPFGNVTVLENVVVGAFCRTTDSRLARAEAVRVLETVGMAAKMDLLARSLTIADRKRLELARALATRPHLLLLDEVMAGLNPGEVAEMIAMVRRIRDQGVSILVIEHVMRVIMSLCDRIVVLHHGEKIAEGSPAQIASDRRVIEAYLGEEYLIA